MHPGPQVQLDLYKSRAMEMHLNRGLNITKGNKKTVGYIVMLLKHSARGLDLKSGPWLGLRLRTVHPLSDDINQTTAWTVVRKKMATALK